MTVQVVAGRSIKSDRTNVQATFVGDRKWVGSTVGEGCWVIIPAFRGRKFTLEQAFVAVQLAEGLGDEARRSAADPFWIDACAWAAKLGLTVREAATLLDLRCDMPASALLPAAATVTDSRRRWPRWL